LTARLLLEYDGSAFAGWARQPGLRTVQGEVERALGVVLRAPAGLVPVTVAGRTDAGVHALGQVCSYEGDPAPVGSLNALLPDDVAALSCERVSEGFDARRDATSRAYSYRVLTRVGRPALQAGRVLHWPHRVSFEALRECATALVGTRDFTAFTPTETEHVRFEREVYASFWERREAGGPSAGGELLGGPPATGEQLGGPPATGEQLEFSIEADSFMRHMNRVLVGTMLEVAGGRRSIEDFRSLLAGAPRERAGPTAPACGLYLVGVGYGDERVLER
jgi:tRNA pseudouridine38-40 synthase